MFHSDTIIVWVKLLKLRGSMTNLFRPSKNEAQKSKLILGGIVASLILMGYQNCGKVTSSTSSDGSIEQKPAVASLDDVESLTLLSVKDMGLVYTYDVNVGTGRVIRTPMDVPPNDPAYEDALLCLSAEQRAELEVLLQKSKVCFYQRPENSDRVCSMQYVFPYAQIKQIDLGVTNGCSDYHDICSDYRDEFRSAVLEILATIDLSSCN